MKTVIYEHKPERLVVITVTLKDVDEIAKAIDAYSYNIKAETGGIQTFEFFLNKGGSIVVFPDQFIGVDEEGFAKPYQTEAALGINYRKAKKV